MNRQKQYIYQYTLEKLQTSNRCKIKFAAVYNEELTRGPGAP